MNVLDNITELEGQYLDAYAKNLGIVLDEIKPGEATGHLTLKDDIMNPLGSLHGGALFSLGDIVAGTAATASGAKVTTLDTNISYLAPGLMKNTSKVFAHARTVKAGKTIHVMAVEIRDERDVLLSTMNFTFFVMKQ